MNLFETIKDIYRQLGDLQRFAGGQSVPPGGSTGQQLTKSSNADYDTTWATPAGGGDMLASVYDPASIEADVFNVDNHLSGTINKVFTAAEQTKLANISGTNTGDQDLSAYATKANVLELDNTTPFTPDADYEPATKKYVDDNASGAVDSVNSQTGDVVLDADDIDDSSTSHKFVTASDITKLSNLSGTNTGDQDLSGLVPKTTTINGNALSSNVTLDIDDVAPTQTGNSGKVLKTDGTNATWQDEAGWGAVSQFFPRTPPGKWLAPFFSGYVTNQAPVTGGSYIPIRVFRRQTWDALGLRVTTAAAGTVQLALYGDADGYPGDRLIDAGTMTTDDVGDKIMEITPVVLEPGLYWGWVGISNSAVRVPVTSHTTAAQPATLWHSIMGNNTTLYSGGYNGVSATPPVTANPNLNLTRYIALVSLRASTGVV